MSEVAELAYTPTAWVDGVTPVNAANMNKIEAALGATDTALGSYVPLDSAIVAGTRVQANKLLSGHAQPAFRYLGDGKMEWGPGGATAPDTSLYRSAASSLRMNGAFYVDYSIVVNVADATGKLFFGSAMDTNLYRSAAGVLKTDGQFIAGNALSVLNDFYISGTIRFGVIGSADTVLYRSGAGFLKTDGQFIATSYFAFGGVLWVGVSGDANARFVINNDGGHNWGAGGGAATDVAIWRSAAGALSSNGTFGATGFRVQAGKAAGLGNNVFNIWWDGAAYLYIDNTQVGSFAYTSDKKVKKMIKPLESTWDAVKKINPVSYRWRDLGIFVDDGQRHLGFVAQDLEKVFPTFASGPKLPDGKPDESQPRSLNLAEILAAVTKALQEAQARIEILEAKAA